MEHLNNHGIKQYHSRNVFGQGVSILIVDTGCDQRIDQDVSFGETLNIHGLAVSCLIKPPENNSGLVGIAPLSDVTLADVRDPSSIPIDLVLDALQKGIDENVDIISISLGTADSYGPMENMVKAATERGILVFAAAGNSGDRGYEYPAACQSAISVASVNSAHQPSPFNTRNDAVVIFAPGENIALPVGPNGSMEEFSGTSFATPFAAGLAALILSAKRLENNDKTLRISRKEMILLLRSPEHLSLNCEDHSYVMEKTCTNNVYEVREKISTNKLLVVVLIIFLLCAAIIYSIMYT